MGMYNEVYKNCPHCAKRCEVQIGQIVLGFGNFDLNDLDDLAERLLEKELLELRDALEDKTFYCDYENGGCGTRFTHKSDQEDRKELARKLFG